MKYTTAILALAVGALASPQAASITSAPAISSASAVPLSPAISCVNACPPSDVNCKAACLGNARPNASQAIDTNKCAAKCDQGDGSPAAATAFANCVQGCIASLFPSSQTAFGAGGSGNSAASGASATGTGAKPSGSAAGSAGASGDASGSRSGSAAGPQSTGAAAANSVHIAGAGLAGLLAVFAL